MEAQPLNRKLPVMALSALSLIVTGQASAQDSAALEEILVTAQKREQNILEIPFAVSVISEDEIKARGALDIKDLQRQTVQIFPNLKQRNASRAHF